jgi:aminopeptidase N
VVEHEIAHTYFPFYMGTNESRYGFMDEGWATALEYFVGLDDLGKEKAEDFFKQFRVNGWINDHSSDQQIPIVTPGDAMSGRGFANNEYGKAALGYLAVKDLLGDELFKKCLHAYMSNWNGKHPLPWDFFNSFNTAAGKNLNWLWNNWFFSTYYIDLVLKKAEKKGMQYKLSIDNIGGFAVPFDIVVKYTDGSSGTFHQTAAVWEKNHQKAIVNITAKSGVESITLDGRIFMDDTPENNTWKK